MELTLEVDEANLAKAEAGGLEKVLKLTSNLNTSNMVCFNREGKLKKYESAEEILKEFYPLRLEYYEKRKVKDCILNVCDSRYSSSICPIATPYPCSSRRV